MHLESLRITDGDDRERALCLRTHLIVGRLSALERALQVNDLGTDFFHAGIKTQGSTEGFEGCEEGVGAVEIESRWGAGTPGAGRRDA